MERFKLVLKIRKGNREKEVYFVCKTEDDVNYWKWNVENIGGWKIIQESRIATKENIGF